MYIYNLKGLHL